VLAELFHALDVHAFLRSLRLEYIADGGSVKREWEEQQPGRRFVLNIESG